MNFIPLDLGDPSEALVVDRSCHSHALVFPNLTDLMALGLCLCRTARDALYRFAIETALYPQQRSAIAIALYALEGSLDCPDLTIGLFLRLADRKRVLSR